MQDAPVPCRRPRHTAGHLGREFRRQLTWGDALWLNCCQLATHPTSSIDTYTDRFWVNIIRARLYKRRTGTVRS